MSSLAQLAAIRADLNGDGVSPAPAYAAAFPGAMPGMGCPDAGCTGYELVADLDFDTNGNGEADADDAYWNDGAGWTPIGESFSHYFTADFDGNNHTIANLYISGIPNRSPAGMFGAVSGSSIKRVGLVSAVVSGGSSVGGLIGASSNSTISDSYATGSVSGHLRVGGLVGDGRDSLITASYATGNVSGNVIVGGLVGSRATITASYAIGNVSGNYDVGGLVGIGNAITASYATGSVSGNYNVGGLVGMNEGGVITASYAAGRVSATGDTFYIGGLVGYDDDEGDEITASYWDTQASGQAGSYGGVGKTTDELQSPAGYTGIYAEWNLDLDGDNIADDPWDFGNSRQYPALKYGGMDVERQRQ